MDDLVDPASGDPEVLAELVLADSQRLEKLLFQNLARMHGRYVLHALHVSPLVIVDDLNTMSAAIAPDEADSPLVINPYAVLPHASSAIVHGRGGTDGLACHWAVVIGHSSSVRHFVRTLLAQWPASSYYCVHLRSSAVSFPIQKGKRG